MIARPIEAPDIHSLNSAIGWLDLGNTAEAQRDIERISVQNKDHPDVLIVLWKILAREKDWPRALEIADAMVHFAPEKPTGWICLAYSLFNTGDHQSAWDHLVRARERFPEISAIPYFLACLACQMGRTQDATKWLARWNEMVTEATLKETARKDPRLKSVWKDLDENHSGDGLRSETPKSQSEA